jgi:anti-anti-sigma factor
MIEPARIEVRHIDDAAVIALIGEFDLASRDRLRAEFRTLRELNCRRVLLDLSQTRFIDSTTLGVLARAHLDGVHISIQGASGIAQKALEVSGLASLFATDEP